MNLDGESNLKDKNCASIIPQGQIESLFGSVECFEANANLEQWEGNLRIGGGKISCDIKNLLLRGCTLKNIDYAIGVCCYVGNETKILKNSKKPERKTSKIMKIMNRLLLSVFVF
jgi:magnesium-transporting ATPase (P-type)